MPRWEHDGCLNGEAAALTNGGTSEPAASKQAWAGALGGLTLQSRGEVRSGVHRNTVAGWWASRRDLPSRCRLCAGY